MSERVFSKASWSDLVWHIQRECRENRSDFFYVWGHGENHTCLCLGPSFTGIMKWLNTPLFHVPGSCCSSSSSFIIQASFKRFSQSLVEQSTYPDISLLISVFHLVQWLQSLCSYGVLLYLLLWCLLNTSQDPGMVTSLFLNSKHIHISFFFFLTLVAFLYLVAFLSQKF